MLLETYSIVSTSYLLQNSLKKVQFFQKTLLLANISIEIILGILFLVFNNIDFLFGAEKLTWRSYTIVEALPIICQIKLINMREFAKAVLNKNLKTFVIYITTLDIIESLIYPFQIAQIATL